MAKRILCVAYHVAFEQHETKTLSGIPTKGFHGFELRVQCFGVEGSLPELVDEGASISFVRCERVFL